jgi:hypothetical protein
VQTIEKAILPRRPWLLMASVIVVGIGPVLRFADLGVKVNFMLLVDFRLWILVSRAGSPFDVQRARSMQFSWFTS